MSELNDDGDVILGPGDAREGLQMALVNYALWTGVYRHKGEDVWGYLIVNNHTGVVECEGANFPNSLVALFYLEDKYLAVVPNPEAAMEAQKQRMEHLSQDIPQLFRMFEDDDDDGNRH